MFHCVGCGTGIPWDGHSLFAYTCGCGSTTFVNDETGIPAFMAFTASVSIAVAKAMCGLDTRPAIHLDYIVGNSDYTSPEKDKIINDLKQAGFIWMADCEDCKKSGVLERALFWKKIAQHREGVLARVKLGELTIEESIREMVEFQKSLERSTKRTK